MPLDSVGVQLLLTLGVSLILFYGGLNLAFSVLRPVAARARAPGRARRRHHRADHRLGGRARVRPPHRGGAAHRRRPRAHRPGHPHPALRAPAHPGEGGADRRRGVRAERRHRRRARARARRLRDRGRRLAGLAARGVPGRPRHLHRARGGLRHRPGLRDLHQAGRDLAGVADGRRAPRGRRGVLHDRLRRRQRLPRRLPRRADRRQHGRARARDALAPRDGDAALHRGVRGHRRHLRLPHARREPAVRDDRRTRPCPP